MGENGKDSLTPCALLGRFALAKRTNLVPAPAFSLVQTNIPGLPDTTSFTDANPPVSGLAFYRIGVQP